MNDVQFVYDGNKLIGYSNGIQRHLPLTGESSSGMFGWCFFSVSGCTYYLCLCVWERLSLTSCVCTLVESLQILSLEHLFLSSRISDQSFFCCQGSLLPREAPLTIGHCLQQGHPFRGEIDEVRTKQTFSFSLFFIPPSRISSSCTDKHCPDVSCSSVSQPASRRALEDQHFCKNVFTINKYFCTKNKKGKRK